MSSKEYKWLPHLENSIPDAARGYTSSLYAIALEGWRRGLNLKFIKSKRNKSNSVFELSNNEKSHRFVATRGDLITRDAVRICRDKAEAKKYLMKANVPTPRGKEFLKESKESEIIEYAKQNGYPLVVKPIDGTGGRGVIAGIQDENELKEALSYIKGELGYRHLLVEEYFPGDDYRVYVVGDEVVAITKRIPANVLGDGKSTVRELINRKNKQRNKSPILNSSPIRIDSELKNMLKQQGLELDSVPEQGKHIVLKSKNNISAGGDPVDITDEISDKIKNIAISGLKAIPNMPHGALDLMVNTEKDEAVIIEINSQASIRTHLFPMKGTARDVPKKIVDYYFPNTKSKPDVPLYFDFGRIWSEFRKGTADEITLPNIPKGKLTLTRFIVKGRVQRVGYGAWIRRMARDLNIHGFIRHLRNGTSSVVVCGNKESVEKFRKIITTDNSKDSKVISVVEKSRKTPVPIGFEIKNVKRDKRVKDGYFPVRLMDPASKTNIKNKQSRRKKSTKRKSTTDYRKEYYKLKESTSWRVTKPLRKIGKLLKSR